jgi:hypothetical protein
MARSYAGSRARRSAARLDVDAPAGELPDMDAIYVIAVFIVVIGALNRIEFGRFD